MSNTSKWKRRFAALVLIAYWVLIAIGTHLPSRGQQGTSWINDKVLHFSAFAGLAFLLACCVMRTRPSVRTVLILILVALGYGAVDEFTQGWVPTRMPDVRDWMADSAGTAVGLGGYFVVLGLFRSRPSRLASDWAASSVRVKDAA